MAMCHMSCCPSRAVVLLFNVFPLFVCICFVMHYFMSILVNVPWLFLTVPWVGLQCVIVVFIVICGNEY